MKIILVFFMLAIASCNKDASPVKDFEGNLPIVLTASPGMVTRGQNIVSTVRCELSSISGSVYFQKFDIKEISSKKFNITATALYKDWNTQISMPVMWTLDTTTSIKAITAGTYILNFYNAAALFKADTVLVN